MLDEKLATKLVSLALAGIDLNDGQIVHLVGLNLSRSRCLASLAQTKHSDQKPITNIA